MTSLDLALVGNGTIGALIDPRAAVVWCCFPRFDGDPVFCSLLAGDAAGRSKGAFTIQLEGAERFEQEYLPDTPILVTRIFDGAANAIEITDFCPRYGSADGLFCPPALVRQIRPIGGRPSVRVVLSPARDYGCEARRPAPGPDFIAYSGDPAPKLSTNAPIECIGEGLPFTIDEPVTLIFGSTDAELADATTLLEKTKLEWAKWRNNLRLPTKWADAVVRAAITLSIPEAPNTGRNWDYRYCWPRDAYFTAAALGRLNAFESVERYLGFLFRIADASVDGRLIPIYGLDGGEIPSEHFAPCLRGYRGMGPVRIGNKASEQAQHDLYGEAVLTAASMFSDSRRSSPANRREADAEVFGKLERFGEHAADLYDKPDAGLWEIRGAARVHTYSSMMCWAACNELSAYAGRLKLAGRADFWRRRAEEIHGVIWRRAWNPTLNAFTATMDGDTLDASLLLMPRVGFIGANDPRFVGTVEAIEKQLKHGDFVYRYVERDDFGFPENAFLVCTFWYIEALAAMGGTHRERARALFEKVLSARNRHGLLAEDLDTRTLEQWGNLPQTYSMAGIIDCAIALAASNP